MRPRHNGYIAFQSRASALLRESFLEKAPARGVINRLQTLYADHRGSKGGER